MEIGPTVLALHVTLTCLERVAMILWGTEVMLAVYDDWRDPMTALNRMSCLRLS